MSVNLSQILSQMDSEHGLLETIRKTAKKIQPRKSLASFQAKMEMASGLLILEMIIEGGRTGKQGINSKYLDYVV